MLDKNEPESMEVDEQNVQKVTGGRASAEGYPRQCDNCGKWFYRPGDEFMHVCAVYDVNANRR